MFRIGHFRYQPFFDAVTDTGSGAVAEPVDTVDDGGEDSLSEHEAEFGASAQRQPKPAADPNAEPEPDAAAAARDRDKDGKFVKQPRHRARSQQATAEDVPRIQELTRKHREAEERATAAEARAVEAERRASERREERRETREEPPKPAAMTATPAKFPAFDAWFEKNADKDFDDYTDARVAHNYAALRAAERETEAREASTRTFREVVTKYQADADAFSATTPDYDAALAKIGDRDVSLVVQHATFHVGPQAAYYLATHLDELRELTAETLLTEDQPGFAAAVAATKRYLARLVAPEQRATTTTRTAAGATGAARATLPTRAPKPPTLVRSGASRDAEELPGDDASLAEHEHAFGSRRRRA